MPFKTERVTEKDPPTPCLRRCADAGVGMPILRDGSFNKKPQVHIISSNGEAAKLTRMIRLAIAYARTRSPNRCSLELRASNFTDPRRGTERAPRNFAARVVHGGLK